MFARQLLKMIAKVKKPYFQWRKNLIELEYKRQLGNYGNGCILGDKILLKSKLNQLFLDSNVIIEDYATLECGLDSSAIYIGENSVIRHFVILKSIHGKIKVGNNCSINPYATLFGFGDLIIGDWVRIATHVVINPANHLFDDVNTLIDHQPLTNRGVIIEDDVWIGAGAVILDGCKIGKGSVIGAGAVVTKSVDPYSVVVGVPGRTIRKRGEPKKDVENNKLEQFLTH
ncbi:MAG: acyltransferase [Scytonema sp. PMC 1069.18]|nr:acyltransferase [Scytonema sp. PMC 1069.18]MEC4885930.1 acyltransferase [Scytonema sp. PMC 1070.18]